MYQKKDYAKTLKADFCKPMREAFRKMKPILTLFLDFQAPEL